MDYFLEDYRNFELTIILYNTDHHFNFYFLSAAFYVSVFKHVSFLSFCVYFYVFMGSYKKPQFYFDKFFISHSYILINIFDNSFFNLCSGIENEKIEKI